MNWRRCGLAGLLLALAATAGAAPRTLRIHVVPIVDQGHFLSTLLAPFAVAEDLTLEITGHHGRDVAAAAARGDADLVITHADFPGIAALATEARLGTGQVVFANPIALLVPPGDPADVHAARSPADALARIARSDTCLLRNDLKHLGEFQPAAGGPPACQDTAETGTGMGAILAAVTRGAYVWWGLHPFLNSGQPLVPQVFDDPRLLRPLMAWPVVAGDTALAQAAVDFLRAPATQATVARFRFPGRPDLQVWWPYAALDRLAAVAARGTLVVALKNAGARAAAAHRDPAHVAKRGFELRIAQALAATLAGDATRLTLQTLRKPARLPAVAGGGADLGIAMFAIDRTAQTLVDFSVPYFEDGLAVMHRASQPLPDAASLAGRRLLVVARDVAGRDEEQRHLQALLGAAWTAPEEVAGFDAAAARILAGEADALVSHAANIDAYLAQRASAGLARSPRLTRIRYGVALPRDNPALKAQVDTVLAGLIESGELLRWRAEAGLPGGQLPPAAAPHVSEAGSGGRAARAGVADRAGDDRPKNRRFGGEGRGDGSGRGDGAVGGDE